MEISYSGSPSMIIGGGRDWTQFGISFGIAGSSMKT